MRGVRGGAGPGPGRAPRIISSSWAGIRCWRCGWWSGCASGGGGAGAGAVQAPTPAGLAAAAGVAQVAVPPNLIPAGARGDHPGDGDAGRADGGADGAVAAGVQGGAANMADIYPLAPLQEGIFFHHLMAARAARMCICCRCVLGFDVPGPAGGVPGRAAAGDRPARHLPDAVAWEGLPEPVQVVWRQARLPVTEVGADAGERRPDVVAGWLAAAGPWMDLAAGRRCCGRMWRRSRATGAVAGAAAGASSGAGSHRAGGGAG